MTTLGGPVWGKYNCSQDPQKGVPKQCFTLLGKKGAECAERREP